eukprot:1821591-Rhodomonas_salina.2
MEKDLELAFGAHLGAQRLIQRFLVLDVVVELQLVAADVVLQHLAALLRPTPRQTDAVFQVHNTHCRLLVTQRSADAMSVEMEESRCDDITTTHDAQLHRASGIQDLENDVSEDFEVVACCCLGLLARHTLMSATPRAQHACV